jgi:hypothetical protein
VFRDGECLSPASATDSVHGFDARTFARAEVIKSSIQIKPAKKRSWTIRTVNIVGVLLATIAIIWETGPIWRRWSDRATAPKATPVEKVSTQPPTEAIGIAPIAPKGNDSSVSPVPLKLILVHVQPGGSADEGSAQIGVVRESPQTYQAGALLENGARLAEIYNDYVLLEKDGRTARLYLDRAATAGRIGDTAMLMVGGSKEAPPPAKVTSHDTLTDYIRPSPVYDGQSVVGYQVYPGANSSAFYQMGLKPGDLILEIDGILLTEQSSAWDILRQLTDGSVLSAVVRRSNGVEQVNLDGTFLVRAEESRSRGPAQAMLAPVAR